MVRIREATGGRVTADDFLPPAASAEPVSLCPHCGEAVAGKHVCGNADCPVGLQAKAGEGAAA